MIGCSLWLTACWETSANEVQYSPSFAERVHQFEPGPNSGFGATKMPDVVLGAPQGAGLYSGSTDVVSLGLGGVIILDFGSKRVLDGPGPDLVVYENAFYTIGAPEYPFSEFGVVSVSVDGKQWHSFPCDPSQETPESWEGCAGWTPVYNSLKETEDPVHPLDLGGDAFDLADLGLDEIRYVRIHDLSEHGFSPSAVFDLDAVAAIYTAE